MARLGALFAAAALVMAVARGGSRYFYCPIMQLAMSSSCCASAHHREGDDEPEVDVEAALVGSDCCQARRLATVPSSPLPSPPDAPVPPIATLVPAVTVTDSAVTSRPDARFTHPVRAGPKSAGARRADLMIWTC